jgi:hypothetical protein
LSRNEFDRQTQADAGASAAADGPAAAADVPAVVSPAAADLPGVVSRAATWPRRYAILSRSAIVGYTDLEFPVEHGRRAAGVVIPGDGFGRVQHVFALYHEAGSDPERLRQFVEARDALGLMITDGGALPLAARLELISVADPHRIMAHVAIEDGRYWALPRSQGQAHLQPVAPRGPSPLAALHAPPGSGARGHTIVGSAWARADLPRPADMKPLAGKPRPSAAQPVADAPRTPGQPNDDVLP